MFESGKPNGLGKSWAGEEQQDAGIVDWRIHDASPVCWESWHAPMGPVSQFQGNFYFMSDVSMSSPSSDLLTENARVVVNDYYSSYT